MAIKNWWKGLKYWQKGGLFGGTSLITYLALLVILDFVKNHQSWTGGMNILLHCVVFEHTRNSSNVFGLVYQTTIQRIVEFRCLKIINTSIINILLIPLNPSIKVILPFIFDKIENRLLISLMEFIPTFIQGFIIGNLIGFIMGKIKKN